MDSLDHAQKISSPIGYCKNCKQAVSGESLPERKCGCTDTDEEAKRIINDCQVCNLKVTFQKWSLHSTHKLHKRRVGICKTEGMKRWACEVCDGEEHPAYSDLPKMTHKPENQGE